MRPRRAAYKPRLVHVVPSNATLCGVKGGIGTRNPSKAILTVDLFCSRCLNKWEAAHGAATMLSGNPARWRTRESLIEVCCQWPRPENTEAPDFSGASAAPHKRESTTRRAFRGG